jgi:hypothetical protein
MPYANLTPVSSSSFYFSHRHRSGHSRREHNPRHRAGKNDAFCASCHTEPEVTYLARFADARSASARDLAAYHHAHAESSIAPQIPNMRCMDCHQGEGFFGRSAVLAVAAYDALKHYTGTAEQPATISLPIQNEACLKCHATEVMRFADAPALPFILDNHYHYKYFQPNAPPMRCTDCHPGHVESSAAVGFQLRRATIPVCESCHQFAGHGPVKMQ